MPGERTAKLFARLCMQNTFVERAPRHPARGRAHAGTKHIQGLQRQSQSIALRADHVLRRHLATLEFELANRMWRHHLGSFRYVEARHAR